MPNPDTMPVYDRVSLTTMESAEIAQVSTRLLRWRSRLGELNVHWLTPDTPNRSVIRVAEFEPWLNDWLHVNAVAAAAERWDEVEHVPQDAPYAYSFVSCSISDAADRTGCR